MHITCQIPGTTQYQIIRTKIKSGTPVIWVKSYSTTQPLAAKYSYIMYSVIDSSDTSFAYTENI